MEKRLGLNEILDVVRGNVTMSCRLPYTLGNENIERIIKYDALRYFWREYKFANQRTYYYVDLISLYKSKATDIKFITLPDEIEAVAWVYMVNYQDMNNMGYLLPRGSVSLGQTSQPFVAAINVSEFAESMAVMQNMQDALATFQKNTTKFRFDPNSKRFEVQTSLQKNLILEVWANIPEEFLFGDPYFLKYVTGKAMRDYAIHLSFTDMQLAGNSKINTDRLFSVGDEMIKEVQEYIKGISRASFFINRTR